MKIKKINVFLMIFSIFMCLGTINVEAKSCYEYKTKKTCNKKSNSSCTWVDNKCRVKKCSSLSSSTCGKNTDKNKKKCQWTGSTCCPNGNCGNSSSVVSDFELEYSELTCTTSDNNLNYTWHVNADGKGGATVDFSYKKKDSSSDTSYKVDSYLVAKDFYNKSNGKGKCPSKIYLVNYNISRTMGKKLYVEKQSNATTLNVSEKNNNKVWKDSSEKTRTCSYSFPKIVGQGSVDIVILRNSNGLTYTVSDGYKMSDSTNIDPNLFDYDTSKSCPVFYGGCGQDGENKYCSITTEKSVIDNEDNAIKSKEDKEMEEKETDYKDFYEGVDKKYLKCGSLEKIPTGLPKFTKNLYTLVKVIVPIILIVLGMIDFARAVVSNKEENMNQASKRFVRRIAAAVIIFMIFALTQFLVKISDAKEKSDMLTCMKCFMLDEEKCSEYSE